MCNKKTIFKLAYVYFISLYRVSQKTWKFSDEFDFVFVMN